MFKRILKKNLIISICAVLLIVLGSFNCQLTEQTSVLNKPNILFIAVDDLKPMLRCYGENQIISPNIDKLAATGTVFLNNHCQQAICGPSRASLMTGLRPDKTKVWDLKTKMRDINPDILTIPQYFKQMGYETTGVGKIYDFRCVDDQMDEPSWSIPFQGFYDSFNPDYPTPAFGWYQDKDTRQEIEVLSEQAKEKGLKGGSGGIAGKPEAEQKLMR